MSGSNASNPMSRSPDKRKLIAVAHADMVGYSRLVGLDDAGTLQRLRSLRSEVIDPAIDEHGGRIVQTGGDFLLIVFDSIDGAVRCAVRVQRQVPIHDGDQPADRAIRFRVGINIGDAIADGTDLHGDAVNTTTLIGTIMRCTIIMRTPERAQACLALLRSQWPEACEATLGHLLAALHHSGHIRRLMQPIAVAAARIDHYAVEPPARLTDMPCTWTGRPLENRLVGRQAWPGAL